MTNKHFDIIVEEDYISGEWKIHPLAIRLLKRGMDDLTQIKLCATYFDDHQNCIDCEFVFDDETKYQIGFRWINAEFIFNLGRCAANDKNAHNEMIAYFNDCVENEVSLSIIDNYDEASYMKGHNTRLC
jgi:hypothetical protein